MNITITNSMKSLTNKKTDRLIKNARKYMHPSTIQCVMYHFPCSDGFGSYFSARYNIKHKVKYIGIKRGQEIPDISLMNIVVIDFSFDIEQLRKLRNNGNKIMILDHHSSAQENLQGEEGVFFDMNRSGAVLAWNYFTDDPVPYFLELIQDIDLWKFNYKDSEPFNTILCNSSFNYNNYLKYLDKNCLEEAINNGQAIIQYNNNLVNIESKKAKLKLLMTPNDNIFQVKVLNCTSHWLFSKIGDKLTTGTNYVAFLWYYDHESDKYIISLRTSNKSIDVGKIAAEFNGGGHPGASSFSINTHINSILQNL